MMNYYAREVRIMCFCFLDEIRWGCPKNEGMEKNIKRLRESGKQDKELIGI